jgi:serine/threonine protein kinase
VDGNLWCHEKYCPSERPPEIFDNGEWFGNIEIVEMLAVLQSAAVYEARRGKSKVLLKIAHKGCHEKLKREAQTLLTLKQHGQHPMLPVLLPAHEQAGVKDYPYGKLVVNGQVKYFMVFQYAEGDILRSLLLKNPQPWYQHAGWMVISLADVLAYLHQNQKLHLCLSPEIILVRYDKQEIPRPVLLDLGIADSPQTVRINWQRHFSLPAYTAPELVEMQGMVGSASDVYGLGLLLYEMLAGKPAFEFRLQKDEDIYQAVLKGCKEPTGRTDLKNIPAIAEKAIQLNYDARQEDVFIFGRDLQANFPPIPREKKGVRVKWHTVAIIVGAALAISLLLVLAVAVTK